MLQMNVYLSIKALEERPAQEEGDKQEKRQSRPRRPKQEKRDFDLPETQTGFSMADLFGDINCNIQKSYLSVAFLL